MGNILGQYLDTFDRLPGIQVTGVSASTLEHAQTVAQQGGLRALTTAELLADPDVDLIVNLTPPAAHSSINEAAVAAGKHVYSEKPLGLSVADAERLLRAATSAGVQVGCAPDTFLGTGLQTTIGALRSGVIGAPVAAVAIWGGEGPEAWHPNPQFFYAPGGGPVLDIGPYYLTALVTHLGPVVSVSARHLTSTRPRIVGSGPLAGTRLNVEAPTYATAILEHENGVLSTVILSFDILGGERMLEIFGTQGRLRLPDPNQFSERGSVQTDHDSGVWTELPDAAGYVGAGRGVGAVELLSSVRAGRLARASGLLALHVTEILAAIDATANGSGPIRIASRPEIPEPVALGSQP